MLFRSIASIVRREVGAMGVDWAIGRAVEAALGYFRTQKADLNRAILHGLTVAKHVRDYGLPVQLHYVSDSHETLTP